MDAMNCPKCGGPLQLDEGKDYLVCPYCTTMHFPDPNADGVRVLGGESADVCPLCKVPLVHAAVAGRRLLYCERCRGMLMPMGALVTLIDTVAPTARRLPRPADPKSLERKLHCPRCRRLMDTHLYAGPGGIVIDSCSGCNLDWLDYGELRLVLRRE